MAKKERSLGINVGSKLDNIHKIRDTLKMILACDTSDELTKQRALDVLGQICAINNVNINGNSVSISE